MSDLILFTGAGFTKNFGGFLGDEMWYKIFNNPKIASSKNLRSVFLDDGNFNYEKIYGRILRQKVFGTEDKEIIKSVMLEAYEELDKVLTSRNAYNQDLNFTINWIKKIFSNSKGKYFFTLNQDLLIERYLPNPIINELNIPGMVNIIGSDFVKDGNFVRNLPFEKFIQINEGYNKSELSDASLINYIKIHGSFGWKDGEDDCMVIGSDKTNDLKRFPLLWSYLELFEKVINEGDKKLLVIGYGFADDHINHKISAGIESHGLKLFVISPEPLKNFKEKLENSLVSCEHEQKCGSVIFKGLICYFPYYIKDLFPFKDRGPQAEINRALGLV